MNFKEEYQKDFESIKPDDDFKNNLARQMNQARPARSGYRKFTPVLAMVAALTLVVGIGFRAGVIGGKYSDVGMKAENTTTVSGSEGLFAADKWYGDATTDEEIYEKLVELLQNSLIDRMYCSTEATFSESDLLNEKDTQAIVTVVLSARVTTEEFSGAVNNYMVVFGDGTIVKFAISDAGHIRLNDADMIFKN